MLTERERACLAFCEEYITTHGYAPTLRDVCAGLGFKSTNRATYLVGSLARKGYVTRGHVARSIRIIRRSHGDKVPQQPHRSDSLAEQAAPHLDALMQLPTPPAVRTLLDALRQFMAAGLL